jgi:hypothetical protein
LGFPYEIGSLSGNRYRSRLDVSVDTCCLRHRRRLSVCTPHSTYPTELSTGRPPRNGRIREWTAHSNTKFAQRYSRCLNRCSPSAVPSHGSDTQGICLRRIVRSRSQRPRTKFHPPHLTKISIEFRPLSQGKDRFTQTVHSFVERSPHTRRRPG